MTRPLYYNNTVVCFSAGSDKQAKLDLVDLNGIKEAYSEIRRCVETFIATAPSPQGAEKGISTSPLQQGEQFGYTLAFCHNDLLSGNVLLTGEALEDTDASNGNDGAIIIDYEYASYNYRAFDIANHFCKLNLL